MQYDKVAEGYRITKTFYFKSGIIPHMPINDEFSSLDKEGLVTIRKGFCWDGATGAFDTKDIMLASCIHDAFCNWYNKKLITTENRKAADRLFQKINKEEGMPKPRRNWTYQAVRKFLEIKDKIRGL